MIVQDTRCPICSGKSKLMKYDVLGYHLYGCKACELEFLHPQPTDAELDRIYSAGYYDAWNVKKHEEAVRKMKRLTFAARLDLIPRKENARVLDCGCAKGYFLEEAEAQGYEPWGIELNPAAATFLANRFGSERIFNGEFLSAPFARHTFYAVFMTDFIEHVRDPLATLSRAADLLEDDGYIVITTPNLGSLTRSLMRNNWLHYKVEHLNYFSKRSLSFLLEGAGFQQIRFPTPRKYMTLDYLNSVLQVYPNRIMSLPMGLIASMMPSSLLGKPFQVSTGDLLAVTRIHRRST